MKNNTKWKEISFLISSKYRMRVLRELDHPKTPSRLSKDLGINKSHISRALSELENNGLVRCLTPEVKKGRIYEITNHGKNILRASKNF